MFGLGCAPFVPLLDTLYDHTTAQMEGGNTSTVLALGMLLVDAIPGGSGAKGGVKIGIKGFAGHAVNRAIERGVKPQAILDALKNPLKIGDIKIDSWGFSSQRFIGASAEVVINPKTGKIISVNPTSTKKALRLSK